MTEVIHAMGSDVRGIHPAASRSAPTNASTADEGDRPRGALTFEVPRLFRPEARIEIEVEIEVVAAVPARG